MAKSMCSRCGVRWAQCFSPPLCRGCATGRVLPARRESEDDSAAVIEAKYRRAMSEIKARNRHQPSQEYRW